MRSLTPESAKVTSVVHGEPREKREKWVNVWICEMMNRKKGVVDIIVVHYKH